MDTSGMKIAESVGGAATKIANVAAQRLGEQEQVRIDQQANNALLKYSLSYQQQSKVLQEQYADNPAAYPEAMANMGTKMQEEYSARIPDERIRSRFGKAANTVVRAGVGPAMGWVAEKDKENAYVAWTGSLDIAAQVAGEQTTRMGFWNSLNSIATISASNTEATGKERLAEQERRVKEAAGNYYRNRAVNDPINFTKELDDSKNATYLYQGEDGKKHTFTVGAKEIASYKALAKDSLANMREKKEFDQLMNSNGRTQELVKDYYNNDVGLAEVAQHEEDVSRDPEATKAEKESATLMLRIARNDVRKTGVIDMPKILEVQGDYQILKAKLKKKKDKPQKYMTELLETNNKVLRLVDAGTMPLSQGMSLMRAMSGDIAKAIDKGVPRSDPMSRYYRYMDTKVKAYEGITPGQKDGLKAEAYQNFIERKLEGEDRNPGVDPTREEYNDMAAEALGEAARTLYPEIATTGENPNAILNANSEVQITQTGSVSERLKATQRLNAAPKYVPGKRYFIDGKAYMAEEDGLRKIEGAK